MLDSGAFTASTLGKEIHLDDFARFVREVGPYIHAAFNLDVIGDQARSDENYKRLNEQTPGVTIIPVWQKNDSAFKGLEDFLELSPYVALGGLVTLGGTAPVGGLKASRRGLQALIRQFCKRAKSRQIHLLGVSNINTLRMVYPTSSDSTSWLGPSKFGGSARYAHRGKLNYFDPYTATRAEAHRFRTATGFDLDMPQRCKKQSARGDTEFGPVNLRFAVGALSEMTIQKELKKRGTDYYLAGAENFTPGSPFFKYLIKKHKELYG